jgi:biotin operon repressor
MLNLLRKSSMSIASLEKKLKMSRRTVFRYLLAVEKTGCQLELNEKGYHLATVGASLRPLLK